LIKYLIPLTTDHVPMLISFLKDYPRESCDYSVCNLLTWGKIYNNQFCHYQGRLVVYNTKHSYVFFPMGEYLPAAELAQLLRGFKEIDPKVSLIQIPEEYVSSTPEIHDYFELSENRDWDDYVYSCQKMVELRGKKLAKKKNLISQFRRLYPDYKVLRITPYYRENLCRFTQKWRLEREVGGDYLKTEFEAIRNTLDMWDSLPVDGIIICIDRQMVAYSIFSPQTKCMATIHFEKYDPTKKGSGQLINWETARYLNHEYKWLNREQDIGLPGLRQAKNSYMPDRMIKFIKGELK
jgi:hypothetical protein